MIEYGKMHGSRSGFLRTPACVTDIHCTVDGVGAVTCEVAGDPERMVRAWVQLTGMVAAAACLSLWRLFRIASAQAKAERRKAKADSLIAAAVSRDQTEDTYREHP